MNYKKILEHEKKFFDAFSDYDVFPKKVYNLVIEEWNLKQNTRGLSIGCGDGSFEKNIKNCKIDGIDISSKLIKKATHLNKPKVGDAHFADRYFNEKYDWICFFGSLHHLTQYQIVLYNANKLLKSNGFFYFFEPNKLHFIKYLVGNLLVSEKTFGEKPLKAKEIIKVMDFLGHDIIKLKYLTPSYINMNVKSRTLQLFKHIPSKYFQSFWILVSEKKKK